MLPQFIRGKTSDHTFNIACFFISVSCDSSAEISPSRPSTSTCDFAFTSVMNFNSESDPAQAADKKPLSALSVSESQKLNTDLLESIAKCMQVQNSLYRLVLLKLHSRVKDAGETCSREFDSKEVELHEASSAAISGMNVKDSPDPAIVKSPDAEEGLDLSFNDPTKKPNIKSLDGNDKNVGKRGADVMITASNNGNLKDISGISPKAPKLESLEGPLSSFNREGKKGLSDTSGFSSLDGTGATLNDTPEALLGNQKGGPKDASKTLLNELAQPLQALIRCTQIQRSLFHKLIQVNAITSNDGTALSSGICRSMIVFEIKES